MPLNDEVMNLRDFGQRYGLTGAQMDYAEGKINTLPPIVGAPTMAYGLTHEQVQYATGRFDMGGPGPIPRATDAQGIAIMQTQKSVVVAADPGQMTDPFAIAVIRSRIEPLWRCSHGLEACQDCKENGQALAVRRGTDLVQAMSEVQFDCVEVFTLPLRTPHNIALAALHEVYTNAMRAERCPVEIICDAGGIGRIIAADGREKFRLPITGIVLSGGNQQNNIDANTISIPKNHVVAALDGAVNVAPPVLHFPKDMPGWASLLAELANFASTTTPSGAEGFEARAGSHDDRCLAIAYGVYRLAPRSRGNRVRTQQVFL